MGVPYFTPYIPSPEGRGFTARADKYVSGMIGLVLKTAARCW